jgi:predicted nicotinamide N-methyase
MWPSSVVLSNLLVHNSEIETFLQGKTVLEIGAGCGLAGLVAAQLQQKCISPRLSENSAPKPKVILTDFNHVVLENLRLNVVLNDLDCDVVGLDFYQQTCSSSQGWIDMGGKQCGQVDLVLGADIICQPSDAVAAATTVMCALKAGGLAYIVCADAEHRFGVERFSSECESVGLGVKMHNVDHIDAWQLLGIEKTAGYVENMNLTIFTLEKKLD